MKNADLFKATFGLYATEVWAMKEPIFLLWLNGETAEPCADCVDRQAVLSVMSEYWAHNDGDDAMQLSMDDIRKLPCVTPTVAKNETVEDCVSRADVLEKLHELLDPLEDGEDICPVDIFNEIDVLPSVTPAPKMGRWIKVVTEKNNNSEVWHFECSECGEMEFRGDFEHDNYCPNCGARMSEEADDESSN